MSYNTDLQSNNEELAEILSAVNELPEASEESAGNYIPVPETAEVGQTIVVTAVDENGVPTAWEAADMAAGGDEWELLNTITVSDDETANVTFTEDSDGNPLALKKFYLRATGITHAYTYPVIRLNSLSWMQQFGGPGTAGATNQTMPVLFEIMSDGCYSCEWHYAFGKTIRFDGETAPGGGIQSHIDSVNSICWGWGTGATITNGTIFTLYGVRA